MPPWHQAAFEPCVAHAVTPSGTWLGLVLATSASRHPKPQDTVQSSSRPRSRSAQPCSPEATESRVRLTGSGDEMSSALPACPKAHARPPAQQVPIRFRLLRPQPQLRSYVPANMQQDTVPASARQASSHITKREDV